jgi:hypothetical protein
MHDEEDGVYVGGWRPRLIRSRIEVGLDGKPHVVELREAAPLSAIREPLVEPVQHIDELPEHLLPKDGEAFVVAHIGEAHRERRFSARATASTRTATFWSRRHPGNVVRVFEGDCVYGAYRGMSRRKVAKLAMEERPPKLIAFFHPEGGQVAPREHETVTLRAIGGTIELRRREGDDPVYEPATAGAWASLVARAYPLVRGLVDGAEQARRDRERSLAERLADFRRRAAEGGW